MKKILIVEDELVVRSIYRRKFEMSGYQVETSEEGTAALKLLPIFKPDVIQVDIMMPGMDGVEVIRQIRAWPEFRHVPILVLSSFYRPDLAKEAWKAGATKCVSKMDCTPNLVLELVEQLLSGENTGFTPKYGTIPIAEGTPEQSFPFQGQIPYADDKARLRLAEDAPGAQSARPPESSIVSEEPPPSEAAEESTGLPKLTVSLDLPPSKGTAPSRPTFSQEQPDAAPAQPAEPASPGKTGRPRSKKLTRPAFASSTGTAPAVDRSEAQAPELAAAEESEPAELSSPAGPDFRMEIRQDFLKRVPQIQAELRERVGSLIKSKSTNDQLNLLKELEGSISSVASLSGITGFSRVSHLSGALDALIKDLHKKPSQMTASVLRTIAHAMDCLNVLFRDLTHLPQDIPQSILILAVDDEPISRRTISVALGKANLRCIGLEDSIMALTILQENTFDLIFLDAEMPGLSGFELCAELRKLATNKTTPVIFVTSLTKFETRAQSSLSGGNDLIAKPFLMMELAVKALTYLLRPPPSPEGNIRPGSPTE
jgi:CheY-like chemotaxis protein